MRSVVTEPPVAARHMGVRPAVQKPTPRATSDVAPKSAPLDPPMLVAIGASTGGPGALATVLGALPVDYRAAIVVLQHVDMLFASSMAAWLAEKTVLPTRVATEGDSLVPGTVVLGAGNDVHLTLTRAGRLRYVRADLPEQVPAAARESAKVYAPSIDVFFESMAACWSGPAVGVVLTGMGRDGARGLLTLRNAGAVTIAQDRASSVIYGMPKAAVDLAAASEVLALSRIGPRLLEIAHRPPRPLRKGL